ncbi:cellulose biosynthesis protein BcsP [Caballeronia sp. SEWSISQ10-4 2]|uniref:cellulose biosynthesis protein BcsP n=1 Tax=Caballeronia sp. SEWSISQ10-4 2 TaxID=2937438 RepID=UPI002653B606|nr:cellulose biosynthesis protein BcsP [Caballeronia sp. SEWSISQ10-4 2]MDN7182428.1 cellulose biosynthesis protein BcsP [Caballeronia sp. SEWSISQ10-4 2]
MNPSRDIEKLFDKFGGDAGNYQEIGRENEAIHARTRWPLLATLDLSQPSIPNIAPRRDSLLPQTHDRSGEHRSVPNSLTQPPGAAPVNRGKPPLFARAHRKTVPPVANVKLPDAPVGAARFSALADVVEETSNAEQAEAPAVPVVAAQPQPPLQPLSQTLLRPQQAQQPQQPQPRSQPLATPVPVSTPAEVTEVTGFAAALQRSRPAVKSPSLPRVPTPVAVTAPAPEPEPKPQSILGKLFRPQAQAQPAAQMSAPPPDLLEAMFQRLREPVVSAAAPAPVNSPLKAPAPVAGSWLAKRNSPS